MSSFVRFDCVRWELLVQVARAEYSDPFGQNSDANDDLIHNAIKHSALRLFRGVFRGVPRGVFYGVVRGLCLASVRVRLLLRPASELNRVLSSSWSSAPRVAIVASSGRATG